MQELGARDSSRLAEELGAELDSLFDASWDHTFCLLDSELPNLCAAVGFPSSAGSYNLAGLRITHSLHHHLIIVSQFSALWRAAWDFLGVFTTGYRTS